MEAQLKGMARGDTAARRAKRLLDRATTPAAKNRLLWLRDRLVDGLVRVRMAQGQLGPLPDFVIIGSQKCGTTFLYDRLAEHPSVAPALVKEVHFFDFNFRKGERWYRACFPQADRDVPRDWITGEASPYYIFHPRVPRLLAATVPSAKVIALLRNPINRAYSHFHHNTRLGFETLPFEEALAREDERLAGERERMVADERYISFPHSHFGYRTRGIYADQVAEWLSRFAPEQRLILHSEAFYRDTPATMAQVTRFLGLPDWEPAIPERPRQARYPKMAPATRAALATFFAPHNQRLYELLGRDFGWE